MIIINDIKQRSPEWFEYKLGKPSGSKASSLVTSRGLASESLLPYAKSLADELYLGYAKDTFKSNSMERGTQLEHTARTAYEFMFDVDVLEVGIIANDNETYMVSPDGLVGENGMVEIKCPESKEMIEVFLYFKKNRRVSSKYICQPQLQIKTAEREWCDSVIYHPDYPLFTFRHYIDDKIDKMLDVQLARVIYERDTILTTLKEI